MIPVAAIAAVGKLAVLLILFLRSAWVTEDAHREYYEHLLPSNK